jgi:F-type H+-transporting ATPase subunit epsilon
MTDDRSIRLRVFLPEKVLLDRAARKVVAEGESGSFALLPRHVDYVEPLVPGILAFTPADSPPDAPSESKEDDGSPPAAPPAGAEVTQRRPGEESDPGDEVFVAVDEGVLVKCGPDVRVSVRNAVVGPNLGDLETTVRDRFHRMDEREGAMRTALAKLESEVIRNLLRRP